MKRSCLAGTGALGSSIAMRTLSCTSRFFRRRKKTSADSNFFAMSQRHESTLSRMKNGNFDN